MAGGLIRVEGGWVTVSEYARAASVGEAMHPGSTEQLMTYWAEGEGAAKIGWGAPGDFDRCRLHLGKYVRSDEVDGLCANLHHRALGVWPGREHGGDHKHG